MPGFSLLGGWGGKGGGSFILPSSGKIPASVDSPTPPLNKFLFLPNQKSTPLPLNKNLQVNFISIDVQYSQNAVFTFEKGSNHKNHFSVLTTQ